NEAKQKQIDFIHDEIEKLKEGVTHELLWEFKVTADDMITVSKVEEEVRKRVFINVEQFKEEDYTETKSVQAKDMLGDLIHISTISKEYRLVPKDPDQRKAFIERGSGGKYIAHIDGVAWKVGLGMNPNDDGKKIAYDFITKWNGKVIP